jgi:hypothetical protein
MMTEKAIFNGETHDIDVASRATLVFNKTHGESDYPDRLVIDPETAMQHYEWMDEVSDVAASLMLAIVRDFDGPVTKAALERCQPAFRRLAGMLDLTARAMIEHVPVAWKYPEDGLHPQYHGNIADVMLALSNPDALRAILKPPPG